MLSPANLDEIKERISKNEESKSVFVFQYPLS